MKMNIVAVIAVTAAICSTAFAGQCDKLNFDKKFDAIKWLTDYSGKIYLYSSFADGMVCGIGSFDATKDNFIFTKPDKTVLTYHYTKEGDGKWGKQMEGEEKTYRYIFGTEQTKCGSFACFVTCDGSKTKAFDCYLTSKEMEEKAKKAFADAKLLLSPGTEQKFCPDIKSIKCD